MEVEEYEILFVGRTEVLYVDVGLDESFRLLKLSFHLESVLFQRCNFI